MKKFIGLISVTFLLISTSFTSVFACNFKNDTPVTTLSAAFEAWKVVTSAASECGNVTSTLDQEFSDKLVAAMTSNPSQFTVAGVANSTNTQLLDVGATRALDDLVAKHGSSLQSNQLIKVDGKIMAIAMMVNAQHLFYREDILNELNIAVPTTYADVLAASKKILPSLLKKYFKVVPSPGTIALTIIPFLRE